MNRELKFRAWDKKLKSYRYFDLSSSLPIYSYEKEYSIEQYTGLKDKRTKQTFSLSFRLSPERAAILKKFFYENEFSSQDFLQRKKDRLYSVTDVTI